MHADLEDAIDVSEEARALGEANCLKWLPTFLRWAEARTNDLEILVMAAYCDGFRKGLKATLPKSEADLKAERIAEWRAKRVEQTKRQDAKALNVADVAQELGNR